MQLSELVQQLAEILEQKGDMEVGMTAMEYGGWLEGVRLKKRIYSFNDERRYQAKEDWDLWLEMGHGSA